MHPTRYELALKRFPVENQEEEVSKLDRIQ
jgi:hypothetical protein